MMKQSLAVTFDSMVSQSDFNDAMTLISSISAKEIPLPTVVNSIIFNILMSNCEGRIARKANEYLDSYLLLLPKRDPSLQYDFREVLQDKSGVFGDIWSVFSHLVESSFRYYKISSSQEKSRTSKFVKYPNCDILIDFYAKMLTKYLSLEVDFFNDSEERIFMLLEWINKFYKEADVRIPVLGTLHTLLDEKLKLEFSLEQPSKNIPTFINSVIEKCPDVFNNSQYMQAFFALSKCPHFKLKICQYQLFQLIYKKKLKENKQSSWTLKTILYNYFFYNYCKVEVKKSSHASTKILKNGTKSPKNIKEVFFPENVTGGCSLHEFCRKNLYGDLYEVLLQQSCLRPNVRNSAGRTPLHEACLSDSYYCVKFLLEELNSEGDQLDLKAVDNVGLTPLHCAVYVNALDIAQILLKRGGSELVLLKDKFGEKAIAYAKSKKMKDLLEHHESNIPAPTNDTSSSDSKDIILTVPAMKDKEEYSIFLYGLFILLSHYLESSNLYTSMKENVVKLSHKQRKCAHYVSVAGTAVCDEDASVFESLPQVLDCFSASVNANANAIGVNVRVYLFPISVLRRKVAAEV